MSPGETPVGSFMDSLAGIGSGPAATPAPRAATPGAAPAVGDFMDELAGIKRVQPAWVTPMPGEKRYQTIARMGRAHGFIVTSDTGGDHAKNSPHYRGEADDFRTRDKTDQQVNDLIANAIEHGYGVEDDRDNPKQPHVHIQWGPFQHGGHYILGPGTRPRAALYYGQSSPSRPAPQPIQGTPEVIKARGDLQHAEARFGTGSKAATKARQALSVAVAASKGIQPAAPAQPQAPWDDPMAAAIAVQNKGKTKADLLHEQQAHQAHLAENPNEELSPLGRGLADTSDVLGQGAEAVTKFVNDLLHSQVTVPQFSAKGKAVEVPLNPGSAENDVIGKNISAFNPVSAVLGLGSLVTGGIAKPEETYYNAAKPIYQLAGVEPGTGEDRITGLFALIGLALGGKEAATRIEAKYGSTAVETISKAMDTVEADLATRPQTAEVVQARKALRDAKPHYRVTSAAVIEPQEITHGNESGHVGTGQERGQVRGREQPVSDEPLGQGQAGQEAGQARAEVPGQVVPAKEGTGQAEEVISDQRPAISPQRERAIGEPGGIYYSDTAEGAAHSARFAPENPLVIRHGDLDARAIAISREVYGREGLKYPENPEDAFKIPDVEREVSARLTEELKAKGYDGVIFRSPDYETVYVKFGEPEAPPAKAKIETPGEEHHAIQEQSPGQGVLREEGPQVGLQAVGEGNAKPESTPQESAKPQTEVAPTADTQGPSHTETSVVLPDEPIPPPKPTMATEPPSSVTQAKNAATAAERKAIGLDELPAPARKPFAETLDRAKSNGMDAKADQIAGEVNKKARPLSDEETAGMVLRLAQLKNDHAAALHQMELAIEAGKREHVTRFGIELDSIEGAHDAITRALKAGGTETGRSLASRKLAINKDYDLVSVLQRAKASKTHKLTPHERIELEELTQQVTDLQAQLEHAHKTGGTRIRPNPKAGGAQAPRSVLDRVTAENKVFTKDRVAQAFKELTGAPLSSGAEAVGRHLKLAYEIAGAFAEAGYRRFSRFMVELRTAHPEVAAKLSVEQWKEAHDRAKADLDKMSASQKSGLPPGEQAVISELKAAREERAKAMGASRAEEKAKAQQERVVLEWKAEQLAKKEAAARVARREQAVAAFNEDAKAAKTDQQRARAEARAARQTEKAINDAKAAELAREEKRIRNERRQGVRQAFSEEQKAQRKAQADYDREYRQRAKDAEVLQHTNETFQEMARNGIDVRDIEHQGAMEHFVADLLDKGASAEDVVAAVKKRLPGANPYDAAVLARKAVAAYRARFQGGSSIGEQYLERGNAALHGEDVRTLRMHLDYTLRKIDARVGALKPRPGYQKLDQFLTSSALASITNRVWDFAANTVSLGSFMVRHPVNIAVSPLLDRFILKTAGFGVERPLTPSRIARIRSGARERLAIQTRETWEGSDPDTLAKYGQGTPVTRATGLTDVPFKEFYTQMRLDDVATTMAKHLAKSKQDVPALRDQIMEQFRDPEAKGPLTSAEIEDGLAIAHDYALRATFNVDNVASHLAGGAQMGVNLAGKAMGPVGEHAAGYANTLLVKPVTRFAKVIGNVALDRANYHPTLGIGEAVARVLWHEGVNVARRAKGEAHVPFSPQQAMVVNNLVSKGLAGLALLQVGRYLVANGIHPKLVSTEGGKKYYDFGDLDQIGGPLSPVLYGMALEETDKQNLTDKQKQQLRWDTSIGLLANQPIVSGPQRLYEAMRSSDSFGKFAGQMVASMALPSQIRDWARREDAIRHGQGFFGNRRVDAPDFKGQITKNIPILRDSMKDAGDKDSSSPVSKAIAAAMRQ